MNAAAFACGMLLDVFRIRLRHGLAIPSLPPHSLLNSGNRCGSSAAGPDGLCARDLQRVRGPVQCDTCCPPPQPTHPDPPTPFLSRLYLLSGCITSAAGLLVTLLLSSDDRTARAGASSSCGGPPKRSRSDVLPAFERSGGSGSLAYGSSASLDGNGTVEVELPVSPVAPLLQHRPGSGHGQEASAAEEDSAAENQKKGFWFDAKLIIKSKGFAKFLAVSSSEVTG